jgi:deoxyribodipyrimidine photo-lyase
MRDPLRKHDLVLDDGMMHGGSSRGGSVVVWLRQYLRIHDNPALAYAASLNVPMHVVYIHAPDSEEGGFPIMGAAKMWLHYLFANVAVV